MRKTSAIFIFILALSLSNLSARPSEHYLKFQINSRSELAKLTQVISIDNVDGYTVYAYAVDDQLRVFETMGYGYEILPHPSSLITPRMASDKVDIAAWDVYPTYDGYVTMMNQFAADYPGLCQIVNAGSTTEGRAILYAKISDNVGIEEDEPEVLYSSTMHGDETTGYVLMLRLIDSLLVGYGSDSLLTRLVDSCEIWINPLANPDGTYALNNNTVSGATRSNANGADLNRNFPDPDDGPHPDGREWQAETIAQMNFAENHSIVISGNHHGGIEVINYPWDTWARLHIDNDWFVDVCRQYADSAQYYSPSGYMNDLNDGITNGYAWYEAQGGRQDYMNYWHGCREVTMELSNTKLLPASQLPDHWIYNRVSFFDWFEQALYGIRGVVTDAITGDPVFATITLIGHDIDIDSSRVFTDPDVGDYHRMVGAGTYALEFSSPGYYTDTVSGVSVTDLSATRVDFIMNPLPNDPDLQYSGNDAGDVDPGDDVSMHITLVNNGFGNSSGVSAALSTSDSYITMTQTISAFPNILASGDSGISLSSYQFSVSSSCPIYHMVQFTLDITADGGYTNSVTFDLSVGRIIEDFETGDFAYMPWVSGGDLEWTITGINPFEGSYSAKSGEIADGENSSMSLTFEVSSPGDIIFNYRVSSENSYDYLRFYIDDIQQGAWSGESGWTEVSYPVDAGTRTFKWEYAKDGTVSSGDDCGWIDKIILPPVILPLPEITTASLPDWTGGYYFSQQLEASGGIGQLTWTDKYNNLDGTGLTLSADGLVSGLPIGGLAISFTAEVTDALSESDLKVFEFAVNPVLIITTQSLPEGYAGEPYSYQLQAEGGTGNLTWRDKNGDLGFTGFSLSASGLLSGMESDTASIAFTAEVSDTIGATRDHVLALQILRSYICGDANNDGLVNIGDAVYLINYIFREGLPPDPVESGYANGDDTLDVGDAVYIVNYIFKAGGAPICP